MTPKPDPLLVIGIIATVLFFAFLLAPQRRPGIYGGTYPARPNVEHQGPQKRSTPNPRQLQVARIRARLEEATDSELDDVERVLREADKEKFYE